MTTATTKAARAAVLGHPAVESVEWEDVYGGGRRQLRVWLNNGWKWDVFSNFSAGGWEEALDELSGVEREDD